MESNVSKSVALLPHRSNVLRSLDAINFAVVGQLKKSPPPKLLLNKHRLHNLGTRNSFRAVPAFKFVCDRFRELNDLSAKACRGKIYKYENFHAAA